MLAAKAGFTYLLCFDNTFSRFRAKTVIYSVIRETGAGSDNMGELGWTKRLYYNAIFYSELSVDDLVKAARDGSGKDEITKKKKKNYKT